MKVTDRCTKADCDGQVIFDLGPYERSADQGTEVLEGACDVCDTRYKLRTNIKRR